MVTHDSVGVTIELSGREVHLTEIPVTITRESDHGVRTCSNGDPGVPPSDEVLIDIDLDAIEEALFEMGVDADFDEIERAIVEEVARRS